MSSHAPPKPGPAPTDPVILNNALRALSLDIASAATNPNTPSSIDNKPKSPTELISPSFDAPTPLSTPILPLEETLSRFMGAASGSLNKGSLSLSLAGAKDGLAAADGLPSGRDGSTPKLSDAFDHTTPPATPRAGGIHTGTAALNSAVGLKSLSGSIGSPFTATSGPLSTSQAAAPASPTETIKPSLGSSASIHADNSSSTATMHAKSAVTGTTSSSVTPTVRVRPAAGDALEIATRLQQQQQQHTQAQMQLHIQAQRAGSLLESIRTPSSQLDAGTGAATTGARLGKIGAQQGFGGVFTPPATTGADSIKSAFQAGTSGLDDSSASSLAFHSAVASQRLGLGNGGVGMLAGAGAGEGSASAALLGSAFVSPSSAADTASQLAEHKQLMAGTMPSAAATGLSGFATAAAAAGLSPTPPRSAPPPPPAANPAALSAALGTGFELGMTPSLDPTTMLFHNEHTANVYVNALPLTTTDDDLYRIGSAFGNVLSHKAIIAAETGLCKGYGFLLYTS
ncbi:hypothetical protein OC844_003903, partial [Tilletia horrida]